MTGVFQVVQCPPGSSVLSHMSLVKDNDMCIPHLLIRPAIHGLLGCFHVLTIVKSAALNIQVLLPVCIFFLCLLFLSLPLLQRFTLVGTVHLVALVNSDLHFFQHYLNQPHNAQGHQHWLSRVPFS